MVEKTIHSIRSQEDKNIMEKTANVIFLDFKSDEELTGFPNPDFEDFYETK